MIYPAWTAEHPSFFTFSFVSKTTEEPSGHWKEFLAIPPSCNKAFASRTRPICGSNNSQARQLSGDRFVKGGKRLASKMNGKAHNLLGIGIAPRTVMIMVVEQHQCARASLSELLS